MGSTDSLGKKGKTKESNKTPTNATDRPIYQRPNDSPKNALLYQMESHKPKTGVANTRDCSSDLASRKIIPPPRAPPDTLSTEQPPRGASSVRIAGALYGASCVYAEHGRVVRTNGMMTEIGWSISAPHVRANTTSPSNF